MTNAEIYTMLNGITSLTGKVAYRAFPEGEAVALPFLVYLEKSTKNFGADNKTYQVIRRIDIELYTKTKDETTETAVEQQLDTNGIFWNKTENYLNTEKCYQIIYEIEV